jgi:hypothetical protein
MLAWKAVGRRWCTFDSRNINLLAVDKIVDNRGTKSAHDDHALPSSGKGIGTPSNIGKSAVLASDSSKVESKIIGSTLYTPQVTLRDDDGRGQAWGGEGNGTANGIVETADGLAAVGGDGVESGEPDS